MPRESFTLTAAVLPAIKKGELPQSFIFLLYHGATDCTI
jgi:hypothetical protein